MLKKIDHHAKLMDRWERCCMRTPNPYSLCIISTGIKAASATVTTAYALFTHFKQYILSLDPIPVSNFLCKYSGMTPSLSPSPTFYDWPLQRDRELPVTTSVFNCTHLNMLFPRDTWNLISQ